MTLSEEDVLWYKQNIPNTPFKDFEKIVNVIGNGNGEAKTEEKQSKNEKTAPVTYLQKYSDNQYLLKPL